MSKNKGAITVFLSIVLSAVFLVVGTFTDAARINLAHSHIQRSNMTALSSLLACYNNQLKDQYGLFGVYMSNDLMQEIYEEYLAKNLNISDNNDYLYDFCIEKCSINQSNNLENRDIFEKQVMEFMKYRAPYELTTDLLSKIDGIKNITSGAKVYKRKMETDKQASIIGNAQVSLQEKSKKINQTKLGSLVTNLKSNYVNLCSKYDNCLENLKELRNEYSSESDKDSRLQLQKRIISIQEEMSKLLNAKDEIKNTVIASVNEYKSLNSQAVNEAKSITLKKKDLLDRIEGEIQYTKDKIDGLKELQKSYQDSLSDIKNIIGEDNSDSIIGDLEDNILICDSVAASSSRNDSDFISSMDKLFETKSINYKFNIAEQTESTDKDNRVDAVNALNKAFMEKENSKTIDNSLLQQLPSRKKYSEEDINTKSWKGINLNDDGFASNKLENLSSKAKLIERFASKTAEELYINEYIMGIFRHDVPVLKGESEISAYNLRSKDKTKRDGYFSAFEVEYIINGNKNEEINSLLVKSEILSIRLMSNVIHIYTDPLKMSRITSLAAALSSWNAGLSTPLVETMLVFSWGMLESTYDLEQLAKGNKISLFKTKEQWVTDISGVVGKKNIAGVENDPFSLSYQDYLKIFLLLMDKDKKLARMQDLVQLNVGVANQGFLIEDCKGVFKADATVSLRNLFFAIPSFSHSSRINISRTYISDEVFIGY